MVIAERQRRTPYQDDSGNRILGSVSEILGTTPELRFTESDQADPAGRFRWQGASGSYSLYKALTALWATQEIIFQHDITNKVTYLNAITDATWSLTLTGGISTTTGGLIALGAAGGVLIRTGNAAGSAIARLQVQPGAGTPDIDITTARLDLNGNNIVGLAGIGGQGNGNVNLKSYLAPTDATAYRSIMWVIDPATDTEYAVAQAVPKAATPLFTMLAPNYTPTTSEVDATNLTFTVSAALHLIANFNSAGAMKTLDLGVLA